MPAVCDLNRLWKSTHNGAAISAIAISGDAFNAGVVTEPSFNGGRRAIGQKVDHATPLEIADQRAVPLPFAPSPIIDADDPRRSLGVIIARPETAQEGIFAHRQQEAACERLSRPATKRYREVPDQLLHPHRATCPRSGHLRPEALAKYRLMAPGRAAPETTHIDHQADFEAVRRQIRKAAAVMAMDVPRSRSAAGAKRRSAARAGQNLHRAIVGPDVINDKASREQISYVQMPHPAHPSDITSEEVGASVIGAHQK